MPRGPGNIINLQEAVKNIYSVICPFIKLGQLADTQILTNLKYIRGTCTGEQFPLKKKSVKSANDGYI